MIVRLTNLAAQTLEGSPRQSWRTSTIGTSGEKSKLWNSGSCAGLSQAAAGGRGEGAEVGAAGLLPLAVALQPGRGGLPRQRQVGEQQCRQLQLLPLWLQLQHRFKLPPSSPWLDQSSSDPQMRCSATSGSGSRPPTTSSPSRGNFFHQNQRQFFSTSWYSCVTRLFIYYPALYHRDLSSA